MQIQETMIYDVYGPRLCHKKQKDKRRLSTFLGAHYGKKQKIDIQVTSDFSWQVHLVDYIHVERMGSAIRIRQLHPAVAQKT